MSGPDEADDAAVRLIARQVVDREHIELHRKMARNDVRLAVMATALGAAVALETALTLYDVWLRLGGRWPWQ